MKTLYGIIVCLLLSLGGGAQDIGVEQDKLISKYYKSLEGIQTAGGDSTITYSIFNQDGLGIKKGRLTCTFISMPLDSFPPGDYSILFRGKYRYVYNKFTIE